MTRDVWKIIIIIFVIYPVIFFVWVSESHTYTSSGLDIYIDDFKKSYDLKGVLDRYTNDGRAVVIIESQNEEILIELNDVPEGSEVGTWFYMKRRRRGYTIRSIDHYQTEVEMSRTRDLLKQIKGRMKLINHQDD